MTTPDLIKRLRQMIAVADSIYGMADEDVELLEAAVKELEKKEANGIDDDGNPIRYGLSDGTADGMPDKTVREILEQVQISADLTTNAKGMDVDQALSALKSLLMEAVEDNERNQEVSEYYSGYNAAKAEIRKAIERIL